MICASSSTRRPASGPVAAWRRRAQRPTNSGVRLGQEGAVADAEVLAVVAAEALVALRLGQRRAGLELAQELLVPARHQRRAGGDAPRRGVGLGLDLGRRRRRGAPAACPAPRAAPKTRPSSSISSATARPASCTSAASLGMRHHQAELVDRHAEAAAFAADAQVAQRRDLQPAADADAVDQRHRRMAAVGDRAAARRAGSRRRPCPASKLLRSVSNSAMSLPGAKALPPAPRSTMQRTASSADSSRIASPSRCHIGLVSAFSLSGRFSTTVAMAPSRSTRIVTRSCDAPQR